MHRAVDGNALTVTSPPLMWLAAIDKLLHNMKAAKFPFERVAAVSGSGQQHGSVFWKSGADADLKSMHVDKVRRCCVSPALTLQPLAEIFKHSFSVENSPIWMDSSTTKYCKDLEDALGGPQRVASITGSRAYERFTGYELRLAYRLLCSCRNQTSYVSQESDREGVARDETQVRGDGAHLAR